MISKNDTIADNVWAIVVTFNRKELLLKCLQAIREQTLAVDKILIMDNASTDRTPEALLENGIINELPPLVLNEPWEKEFITKPNGNGNVVKLFYIRMHKNTGGSGGFHQGIKIAYENGAKRMWLMDDDGLPEKNCLAELIKISCKWIDYIAPNLFNEKGESHFKGLLATTKNDVISFKGGPFNGIIISRDIVKQIGYPMKNFFLWGDEYEYTNRIYEAGFVMITVKDAKFFHKSTKVDYKTCKRGFFIGRNSIYRSRLFKGVFMRKSLFKIDMYYAVFMAFWRFFFCGNISQSIQVFKGCLHGFFDDLTEHQKECCWWGVEQS
ncbi:MAG: hypothetical protein A2Y10_07045 [Planctomycetes bacterium GWF2_41_51]|nr:MAG: hypothetical protein A2Y10_07045 [Planctomycetes bacterium GWF2_41_51]